MHATCCEFQYEILTLAAATVAVICCADAEIRGTWSTPLRSVELWGEEHVFCVVNLGAKPLFFTTVACVCSTKGSVFWDAPM